MKTVVQELEIVDVYRRCVECRAWKPLSEFPVGRRNWRPYEHHQCRMCLHRAHWMADNARQWWPAKQRKVSA